MDISKISHNRQLSYLPTQYPVAQVPVIYACNLCIIILNLDHMSGIISCTQTITDSSITYLVKDFIIIWWHFDMLSRT